MKPDFDRPTALKILEAAFYRCAETDYAHGHIHNEEDVRASTYRHARDAFDLDPDWRLLVNHSAYLKGAKGREHFRPDITLFRWPGSKPSLKWPSPRIEIFSEIKHWTNESNMISDLKKLKRLRESYTPDRPAIAFFAILGDQFRNESLTKLSEDLSNRYEANVWLVPQWGWRKKDDCLYKGPWNDRANLDPWRARLKHFRVGNSLQSQMVNSATHAGPVSSFKSALTVS